MEALGAFGGMGEDVVRKLKVAMASSTAVGLDLSVSTDFSGEMPGILKGKRRGGGAAIALRKPNTSLLVAALAAAFVALLAAV